MLRASSSEIGVGLSSEPKKCDFNHCVKPHRMSAAPNARAYIALRITQFPRTNDFFNQH